MDNNEQKIILKENSADEEIIGIKNENAELEKEIMEEMSSLSLTRNESDENENNEQKVKKRLKFGGFLPETLDWFKRPELAQSSLSTSSFTFNRYCWPHLHGWKVKPHTVPLLTFERQLDDQGNWRTILMKGGTIWYTHKTIPIADINPPDYINGFEKIHVEYIDNQVFGFVEKIVLPLLKEDVTIYFADDNPEIESIECMMKLLGPKANKLDNSGNHFCNLVIFNQRFPGFINDIQSISTYLVEEQEVEDLLMEWLAVQREDGKTKLLEILIYRDLCAKKFINRVKEEFVRSTEPANFIIQLYFYDENHEEHIGYENFKIENKATKEILELQLKGQMPYDVSILVIRYKNDGETTRKIEDLEKQFERKEETKFYIEWMDEKMIQLKANVFH